MFLSRVQIPFFEESTEMQLLNTNISQNAQTTKYSSKKAQDLLNLVLFMFVAFSYYKDGGQGWIRTTEVGDDRFTVCSLWPLGNLSVFWSWRLESNPQPADYKSAALPIELHQQYLT